MKLILLLALVGISIATPITNLAAYRWNLFKTSFGKVYSGEEEMRRQEIYQSNLNVIQQHNMEADMGVHSFYLGVNVFADWTNEEFRAMMNGYKGSKGSAPLKFLSVNNEKDLPESVDWRTAGYVTEVKNQGSCGSCWAFSTTGSMEGAWFKKNNALISLSEQDIMDCSWKFGNMGCNGGLMDNAFKYLIKAGGDDTEASYPYTAKSSHLCGFNKSTIGASISNFVDVPSQDEAALKEAVATVGPVSVAIDASSILFQLYHSGVYNNFLCSSTRLDHGVLAVGYGVEDGVNYWIVKNSWGKSWGMDGYIWMSKDKNNQCGIATAASYPIV